MLVGDYVTGVVKIRDGCQEAVKLMAKGKTIVTSIWLAGQQVLPKVLNNDYALL